MGIIIPLLVARVISIISEGASALPFFVLVIAYGTIFFSDKGRKAWDSSVISLQCLVLLTLYVKQSLIICLPIFSFFSVI